MEPRRSTKSARRSKELDTDLKRDIANLETGLKRDIKELDTGLRRDIEELRRDTKKDIEALKHELTIRLGGMLVTGIVVVAALVKLL